MSRLTEEMIMIKAKDSNIGRVKRLNLWGTELKDVSIVKQMRSVEVLSLSVNCIISLAPFDQCFKLQELYLRRNNISDFKEITHLQPLPLLRCLSLEENPIEKAPNYRLRVIRALPNLKKLDNEEVTQKEHDLAMSGRGDAVDMDKVDEEDAHKNQQEVHEMTQHSPPKKPQEMSQQQPVVQTMPQQMPMPQKRQQQQQISQQMQFSQQIPQQQRYSQQQQQYHYQQPPQQRQQQQQDQHQQQQMRNPSPLDEEPPSPRSTYSQYDRSVRAEQAGSSRAAYMEVRPSQLDTRPFAPPMRECYDCRSTGYLPQYHYTPSDYAEWEEHQLPYNHDDSPMDPLNPSQCRSEPGIRKVFVRENGGERLEASRSTLMNPNAVHRRMGSNKCANMLTASLSLVKELDYSSLQVLHRAVRHRIDELDNE